MKKDSSVNKEVKAETIVYRLAKHDYGLSRDDTNMLGVECISVTLDPTGDYPFFTVPLNDLDEIK